MRLENGAHLAVVALVQAQRLRPGLGWLRFCLREAAARLLKPLEVFAVGPGYRAGDRSAGTLHAPRAFGATFAVVHGAGAGFSRQGSLGHRAVGARPWPVDIQLDPGRSTELIRRRCVESSPATLFGVVETARESVATNAPMRFSSAVIEALARNAEEMSRMHHLISSHWRTRNGTAPSKNTESAKPGRNQGLARTLPIDKSGDVLTCS